jgi:hypothetical protein
MDWQALIVLSLIFIFLAFVLLRTEKRAKRLILLLTAPPILVLIFRWSNSREGWDLSAIAGAAASIGILIWWFAIGRRLSPAEPSIKVWEKDELFE